MIMLLTEAVWT